MGLTQLQQILRILCSKTEWNYAVFWKLKHRARMILTWEDAFYDNHEPLVPSKNMCLNHTHEYDEGRYLRNLLGLAVANMSYRVYSLGEGIIGQVALTGKHQWVFADKPLPCLWSSTELVDSEYCNGWQNQFSAGIKTIVVVSVVPHGVVQLGSLNTVIEDMNLVTLIKNLFYSLQNFAESLPIPVQYFVTSTLCLGEEVEVIGEPVGVGSLILRNNGSAENQKRTQMNLLRDEKFRDDRSGSKRIKLGKGFEQNSETELQTKSSHIHTMKRSFNFSAGCELHEALGSAFRKEQDSCTLNESERTESGVLIEAPESLVNSWFTTERESEDLLEAVVVNACPSSSSVKGENPSCKSAKSLGKSETNPQIPYHIKQGSDLVSESIVLSSCLEEGGTRQDMNSVRASTKLCVLRSPKESSSMTRSTCSEQLEMHVQSAKINRKRSRPGENCRPRPRDRQLIQDRVKELRELVPNGSKCSIDALLARTIKHMLFLESVTKHADKLKKCAESKLHDKGLGLQGFCSLEHGSSWALEVGSQVCPIVVENLNMDGQMLVEMLCEECGHFLELAEAIRGLGLTILRAVIEARDEKLWACFIVEGQNNRCVHRMDILLSLMQLPKPRTTI